MAEPAQGIYEIYYNGASGVRPLGLGSINGGPSQVVELLPGTIAPLWTITKVADNIFTFTVGGAFVAPSSADVAPSSTAFGWKVNNSSGDNYTVQMPDGSAGWAYVPCVSIGVNNCYADQPRIYSAVNYAGVPWWFKRIA
ncbi:hypothetical protein FPV67DRAFT_1666883 [Lyophyllum atratum]|nr:hypothetical protein FPV67DRAFT_1666883 [Lyophyllum atratum]